MTQHLVFGWRTAVLGIAAGQMVVIAVALLGTPLNRAANRSLAALLVVLAGVLVPDIIGFAGFYDAFPWLSFAPFAVPLAIGPLLWFYAFALTHGRLPPRRAWHLAPALLQFAYQAASFCLPFALKMRWDAASTPVVAPTASVALVVSLAAYAIITLRLLRRYRAALAEQRSDDERFAARWLRLVLAALLAILAVRTAYEVYDRLVAPLDYFGAIGLYLAIAAVGTFLAVEGWRHADRRFPAIERVAAPDEAKPPRDWAALMTDWAARIARERWYADPELSLAGLARLLGTNTTTLSRAINLGAGVNFSTFIARQRAEAVALAIRAGRRDDLLTLALDAGFGSKASFNRAFQATFGESPSAYRKQHGADQQ